MSDEYDDAPDWPWVEAVDGTIVCPSCGAEAPCGNLPCFPLVPAPGVLAVSA